MPSVRALLSLALAVAANAKHLSFPALHDRREVSSESMHAHVKRTPVHNNAYLPSGPIPLWYITLDIGATKNLNMLIDSGTAYTYITDPFVYKPSRDGVVLNETHPNDSYLNQTRRVEFYQFRGNGCGNLTLRYDAYADTVNWQGLTIKNQRFGVADYTKQTRTGYLTQLPPPYDGLAGFTIGNEDQLWIGGRVLVSNLYQQGQIDEPRFALAFGTNGTGEVVLGGVDDSLYEGDLVNIPVFSQWITRNIASLTSKGSVVARNIAIWFDSGGPTIHGPADQIRTVFEDNGVQAVETETICGKLLYGYYPCDDPPQIGFELGGTNFDIEPTALRWKDDGANNCTAIVVGKEGIGFWTVGQAFMQGKYIDHHAKNMSMGWAKLKNPTNPASARLDGSSTVV